MGFRKGVSTLNNIEDILRLMKADNKVRIPQKFYLFVDLKRKFYLVDRDLLFKILNPMISKI